jgi:hypothetical protein
VSLWVVNCSGYVAGGTLAVGSLRRESLLCGLQLRLCLPGRLWQLRRMTWLCREVAAAVDWGLGAMIARLKRGRRVAFVVVVKS